MAKRLLFIYNTASGKTPLAQRLDHLIKTLYALDFDITVCPVGTSRDPLALLSSEGQAYDMVACAGGDGTLHYTVNALRQIPPALRPVLGYLPTGSTNDFAATLGISHDAAQACSRFVNGQVRWLDLGDFNGRAFCYVAAFGMFTDVSYSAPKEMKNLMGHLAYVLEGVRRLDLFQTHQGAVLADGVCLQGDFWYGSVSNSTSIGGFAYPNAKEVEIDDGCFEVLLVRRPQNLTQLKELVHGLMSQSFDTPCLHFLKAKSIELQFAAPVAWTLDGEYGGEGLQAHILVKKQELKMVL